MTPKDWKEVMAFGLFFMSLGLILTSIVIIAPEGPQPIRSCDTPNGQIAHCGTADFDTFGLELGIFASSFGGILVSLAYFKKGRSIVVKC